jgi:hypothetical protein
MRGLSVRVSGREQARHLNPAEHNPAHLELDHIVEPCPVALGAEEEDGHRSNAPSAVADGKIRALQDLAVGDAHDGVPTVHHPRYGSSVGKLRVTQMDYCGAWPSLPTICDVKWAEPRRPHHGARFFWFSR